MQVKSANLRVRRLVLGFFIGLGAVGFAFLGNFSIMEFSQRTILGDDARHDSISSDVERGDTAVQKPVNGNDELETIGCTGSSEHSVVSSDDQHQGGRRNRGRAYRTHGRENDQENKVLQFKRIGR